MPIEKEMLEPEAMEDVPMIDMEDVPVIEEVVMIEEEIFIKPESFENGLHQMYCSPNEKFEGELTDEEKDLLDVIEKKGGEWLHVDGEWHLIHLYPVYPDAEEREALKKDFNYDEKAIAAKVGQARRGVNLFFDTDFFRHKSVERGAHAGYEFFSLKHSELANFIYQVGYILGEAPTANDLGYIRQAFGNMRLGGLYHINDEGLLDDLKARFKFGESDFVDITINYHYQLGNENADNKITAPAKVNDIDIDELAGLLEDL